MTRPLMTAYMQDAKRPRFKRTFVALEVPQTLLRPLARVRDRYGRLPYLRWGLVRDWHLTLLFVGKTPPERVEDIARGLHSVARSFAPLELSVERLGYAPPGKPAAMVWAQLTPSPALDLLAQSVDAAVRAVVAPEDSRAGAVPLPHITLARFRERKPVPLSRLVALRAQNLVGTEHMFSRMVFFESVSRGPGEGTTYRPLASFRLANL
ncbi:MAG: RNA 2',3'-cyclic phosphodiesterase [Candidatus Parcubacteria bacterium]|nr:MAG: RNA 2',3'-cyclic phosphodiesterase [Candidatus Parcubacteria bacterium]